MKYTVQLNPRAKNPLTGRLDQSRLWEVKQCADKDSEEVVWHCASVMIGKDRLNSHIDPKALLEFHGVCVRGQENDIVILEGSHDTHR